MKSMRIVFGAVAVILAFVPNSLRAQVADPSTQMRMVTPPFPQTKEPGAIAVAVRGKCEVATHGNHFHTIKQGQLLPPGATVRTKDSGQLDLYFKRTGVAIRLPKDTEIHLAKLEQSTSGGATPADTELDLAKGKLFTLQRGPISGTFNISSPSGLSVLAVKPNERYIISPANSATRSFNLAEPNLSVAAVPSNTDDPQGKDFGENPRDLTSQLLEFDEIQSLAEIWAHPDLGPAGRGKDDKPRNRTK